MGWSAGYVFLAEQFREVGSLKAELFGGSGLVPSISSQRLFDDLPTVGVHALMVVAGRRSCLGLVHRGERCICQMEVCEINCVLGT